MSRLNINNLTNENEDGSPRISGISTFSSAHYFVPPSGTTAERPSDPGEGMIRFNTDSGHLEYYTGEFWDDVIVANNTLDGGNRGVFMGGVNPGVSPAIVTDIDYITISTFGSAVDFGDLSGAERNANNGIMASSTRGLMCGGDTPTLNGQIETLIFSSTGSSTNSGSSFSAIRNTAGCSNSTRSILAGGYDDPASASVNAIEYVTTASLGSGQIFGDLTVARNFAMGCASPTRGVFLGGSSDDVIDYITISSTGNAQDFGDISSSGRGCGCASNSTRGIIGGRFASPVTTNTIEFITIASTGNAQDFGDMTSARRDGAAVSSSTRMVVGAGYDTGYSVALDSIQFLTTGNALDFGDLVNNARFRPTGASNGHGGL